MTDSKTEVIEVAGQTVTLLLTQEYKESKFPTWLISRSQSWFTVLKEDKYLGEVYLIGGEWRAFNSTVMCLNGKLETCLIWLVRNG